MEGIFEFFRWPMRLRLLLDSSAARGIMQRQGCGRVRHTETRLLWAQQLLMEKVFTLGAVGTDENKADIGTKVHDNRRFELLRVMANRLSPAEATVRPMSASITAEAVEEKIEAIFAVLNSMRARSSSI